MRTLTYAVVFTVILTSIGFVAYAGASLETPTQESAPAKVTQDAKSVSSSPGVNISTDIATAEAAADEKNKASEDDINRFTNTIVLIKDFYVKKVGDRSLLDDAIRGMVSGLDPHSEYLDEDAYKTLLMTTSGEFGGLGIEVTPEYGILKIVSPIDDTPASKAGLKAGDYIVAIDNKLVSEMTLQDAVDKMRGKPGSAVTLSILRKSEKTPLTFKLTRETIRITSVKSKMLDNNFGYIRITQFQEKTGTMMRDAINDLKTKSQGKLRGIILDLRNNPGGLLDTAVQVSDAFLNSKALNKYKDVVVYTEGRLPEAQYSGKATGNDMLDGAPMVILINNGSASASEIVAGALQDYQRALIVGTTSFGKGSVQTVIPLDKTHALKLTTALYHTPSGRIIQNVGIVPDVRIEDLKIAAPTATDADLAMIEPIKEYQLKNHLKGAESAELPAALLQSDVGLASSDFQLFEALKILRTMYMLEAKNQPMSEMMAPATITAEKTVTKP
jgi:carboxyl-terminal processing protease